MSQTARLALVKPSFGTNIVDGRNAAGVPNEAANLDAIDAAVANFYNRTIYTVSGAITQKEGFASLNGAAALAMTIADPVAVTDDGKQLTIIAQDAHAHTVSTTTGINGGANHKSTFGGAVGDQLNLVALGGAWFLKPSINQTLSAS